VDADVEKAADNGAEHEGDHRPEVERDGGPVFGAEDGFKHLLKTLSFKLQTPEKLQAPNFQD
jgi:hypothetical protein